MSDIVGRGWDFNTTSCNFKERQGLKLYLFLRFT